MGRQVLLAVAHALTQNHGCHETRHTGVDVHHRAAGEVQNTGFAEEAAAPHPVAYRRVHDDAPADHEQHQG